MYVEHISVISSWTHPQCDLSYQLSSYADHVHEDCMIDSGWSHSYIIH